LYKFAKGVANPALFFSNLVKDYFGIHAWML
jgi:hypothetical protein